MASFAERMTGAAKLDVHVYEEVEADTGATGQAMGVVLLAVWLVGSDRLAWVLEALAGSLSAVLRRCSGGSPGPF